jgi:hypothetical protein
VEGEAYEEKDTNLIVANIIDDSRAVDKEYPSSKSDVLPHFGLPRNWGSLATFLCH